MTMFASSKQKKIFRPLFEETGLRYTDNGCVWLFGFWHCTTLTWALASRNLDCDTKHQQHELPQTSSHLPLFHLKQACWLVAAPQFIQQRAKERWWFHTAVNWNRGNCWFWVEGILTGCCGDKGAHSLLLLPLCTGSGLSSTGDLARPTGTEYNAPPFSHSSLKT